MSNDLTALRWQLIRTIEADQLLEQENIELRKKLQDAQNKLSKASTLHREECDKIAKRMNSTVSSLRSDISEARSQYFAELDLMKQGFKLVTGNLGQMSAKNKELRQKSEALQAANERLQSDLEKSCSHSDKKTAHLTEELSRVKKDLIDSNAQHTNALSIIESKDQGIRKRDQDIDELQKQLKASQQSMGKLSRTIAQLEQHGNAELEELRMRHENSEAAHLEKFNAMDLEIIRLKNEIESYKAEIARLSMKETKGPKKTPFTQYVDLKNQNENLKAKVVDLKNIVRNVDPKHKSKSGHLVGMKHVDSVDSIIAHGKLSARQSQPSSPRNNKPSSRTTQDGVAVVLPPAHNEANDVVTDDSIIDMTLPSLIPQPPSHALSGTTMSLQQQRSAHPTIRVPGHKAAAGQRPSQYRTGAARQQGSDRVIRSSSSEKPTRPQSGTASKRSSRAPSPIVTSSRS